MVAEKHGVFWAWLVATAGLMCAAGLMCSAGVAGAQTLARPGWAGSGMRAEPWWKHAVIYRADVTNLPKGGNGESALKLLGDELDSLQSLGMDALLLDHLEIQPGAIQTLDPAVGTLDEFDELVHQASRRGVRILVTVTTAPANGQIQGAARFWLNRGVAGFRLSSAGGPGTVPTAQQIAELRKIASGYVGGRVVIADGDAGTLGGGGKGTGKKGASAGDGAQILVAPALDFKAPVHAGAVREQMLKVQTMLEGAGTTPVLISATGAEDRPGGETSPLAKVVGAVLFGTRVNPLIPLGALARVGPAAANAVAGPTAAPAKVSGDGIISGVATADPVAEWYGQMSALHRGSSTMRSGGMAVLDHDAEGALVWVRTPVGRGSTENHPVVVACNLSGAPVKVVLTEDLQRLHLRGTFLKTILRTDNGMGPMSVTGVTLAPYSVYIGELKR